MEIAASSAAPAAPSRAEADFTRLFNLSLDLLCIAGLDGFFKRVNPSWTRVLGWSEAELLARPVADFMHPEDRALTLQARAGLAQGIPVRGLENRYLCKDGSYRWLSWQSITEPGEPTVFAVARDITERRQLEHERLILSKLESTGILAGGVAHDFNNLLAGVVLNLDMLSLCGPLNPQQAQFLEQAQQSVAAAKVLTDQLIMFASGGRPSRERIDLGPLLQQAMDLALSGSGLRREVRVPVDLWPVDVNAGQISQVVRALVLNAREATLPGGTVQLIAENVPAASARNTDRAGDWVRVSVIDNGVGISADVLPKVFDPYFSTKQRGAQKGMGLGLTICRTVIRKHGGTILIESCPHLGTTVQFHLPAARAVALTLPSSSR